VEEVRRGEKKRRKERIGGRGGEEKRMGKDRKEDLRSNKKRGW
jgi:hypothetical protein